MGFSLNKVEYQLQDLRSENVYTSIRTWPQNHGPQIIFRSSELPTFSAFVFFWNKACVFCS